MRPTWSTRLLRACLALWLVLSGGELGLVHACPMHGRGAAGAHATAGHAMVAEHHAARHDEAPAKGHACSCIGDCSASSAVVALANAPAIANPEERVASRAVPEAHGDAPVTRAPHRLPFANGPPASALTA